MRIWTVLAVVCVALASPGCDTDEPLTAGNGGGNLQVDLQGQANVPVWNVWDWGEDVNGNGVLDHEPDLDGDGNFDSGEDINHNGILDPGEDRSGNGLLNFDEDFLVQNGLLDRAAPGPSGQCTQCEDANLNCLLDPGEDLNGDNILQSEDVDCDGRLDGNEDRNRNGIRELEDVVIVNSQLDAGIWCETTSQFLLGPVPVPMAGQVLLYRLGNPTPEVLADLGGATFSGLTPYDDRVFADFPDKDVDFGGGQTLLVRDGQQLSAASRRVMTADSARSPGGPGLCTVGFDAGTPNLGVPLPILVQASPGDTLSVRLRMGTDFSTIEGATDYALTGRVLRNGVPLPASGTTEASPGGGMTFTVTVP